MASTILSSRRANPIAGNVLVAAQSLDKPVVPTAAANRDRSVLAVAGNLEHDAGVVRDAGYEGEIEYDVVERHSLPRQLVEDLPEAVYRRRVGAVRPENIPRLGRVSLGAPRTFERSSTSARAAASLSG